MANHWTRRGFFGVASVVAAGGVAAAQVAEGKPIKIVGVCCSPRKGKTTAAAMKVCLEAAKGAGANVEIEMIELGGLRIDGALAAGVAADPDDFEKVQGKLSDPKVGGIIIGTPIYFGNMSSLCKAFLERCMVYRKDFALRNKVGGVLVVGGSRNGGQENTIQSVHSALFAQDMILVGDGRPNGHLGATVWNQGKDDVSQDEWGLATAKNLGKRVAEVALKLAAI
jgi:multimeric flavodoxin WrbA